MPKIRQSPLVPVNRTLPKPYSCRKNTILNSQTFSIHNIKSHNPTRIYQSLAPYTTLHEHIKANKSKVKFRTRKGSLHPLILWFPFFLNKSFLSFSSKSKKSVTNEKVEREKSQRRRHLVEMRMMVWRVTQKQTLVT